MRLFGRGHGSRIRSAVQAWSLWSAACLLLETSVVGADKTAADYFVHSLPGQPDGPLLKMHAGHVEITPESNGHLFFWHFQNRHIGDRQRTVIWLNGGPGCSSMDGALMEIGPYRVKDDAHLEYVDGSWDEFANILFVDNPVGTGFSYVNTNSYVHDLPEMASQFVTFLEKWFALFPEYEHDDIYIAGESYAGQHIPYITQAILNRNAGLNTNEHKWNVKGLLIGNGWISPVPQYQAYLSFAYAEGLVQGGSEIAQSLERTQATCLSAISAPGGQDRVDLYECEEVLQDILRLTQTSDHKCYNMYDVRLKDDYPSCGMAWPPDLTSVTPYLRRQEVTNALHVNPDKRTGWTECSSAVSSAFRAANSKPSIELLPGILEAGVPIVLFSGAKDLICNHLGTEDLISTMSWSDGTGFETSPGVWAPKRDWTFEGEPAGIYQEARNLTYVLFYNSSHMVPFDYPRRTRDMLDRFIGVDIASIGGTPTDSRIDGEKAGLETSVGGHPNSTAAEEEEAKKLQNAEWKAYSRSGEAVLIVVAAAAGIWGFFILRARRSARRDYKYQGLRQGNGALGLETFRKKGSRRDGGDIEAADFDEAELDNLPGAVTGREAERYEEQERFAMGEDSEDEEATPKASKASPARSGS